MISSILIIYMDKCPPITNKFTLPWKTLQLLLTGMLDIYTNLFASSRTNAIQHDNRQDNSTYSTLLWSKPYFSVIDPRLVISIKMDTERRFEAASPKLSNLPIKGAVFMNGALNINKRLILLSLWGALTRLHGILLIWYPSLEATPCYLIPLNAQDWWSGDKGPLFYRQRSNKVEKKIDGIVSA